MQISCNLVIQEKQRRLRASLLCGYAQKGYYTHSNKCKRNLRTKWQVDLFTLFFSILKLHQISINEWNLCKGFDEWQINPQRVLVYLLFHSTHAIVELGNVCSWNLRKRKALNYSISIWGKRNSERERKRESDRDSVCVENDDWQLRETKDKFSNIWSIFVCVLKLGFAARENGKKKLKMKILWCIYINKFVS